METLLQEIALVAARLGARRRLSHLHWGGGTPNILSPADIARLTSALRTAFAAEALEEFAVEIDPRGLTEDQVAAFAAAGVTRVSFGVQDFDPDVQEAIGRIQTFEETARAVELFRSHGVRSINLDLMYGLPNQTRRSLAATVARALELAPDRLAVFGYAHIPSRAPHQRLIDEATLPDAVERFAQSRRLARVLQAAGYVPVGMDHFARPSDSLATAELHRNFQGYTTDNAAALIGFGASAIGRLPQGYVQNAPATAEYARRIAAGELATVRGLALTAEDRVRAYAIERLMCSFALSAEDIARRFGPDADPVWADAEALLESDTEDFVERTADGLRVTDRGRPFIRSICACFDAYLGAGEAKHAIAV
jgi:oxygen-independent coproporphyrinogen-3 oxidase